MTENLLHKLEEKMMVLLAEVEDLRKEKHHLAEKNVKLESDREHHRAKISDLIALLDTVTTPDNVKAISVNVAEPVAKQA